MKHHFVITLTDTRGFRQYRLNQLFKWLILFLALLIILLGLGTWLYTKWLQEAYDAAKGRQLTLERSIEDQKKQIDRLAREIVKKEEALARLGDRLSDLEIFIGEKPAMEENTSIRLSNVALNAAQLGLLFSVVPNGAPLPMQGVTSPFGWRKDPITGSREFHAGIDLRAKHKEPIWATADGVVEFAGYHKRSGYGKLVIIDHGFGFKSYFGHLHKISVRKGDTVIKGDLLGISGNTGRSTGPHLHYEIRYLGRALNPYWFIRWEKANYRIIFEKVKQIPWESFIALISHVATQTLPPSSHQAL